MRHTKGDWMSVTDHGRQGFAKDVGRYKTASGKLAYKRFWLGSDPDHARYCAFTIWRSSTSRSQ